MVNLVFALSHLILQHFFKNKSSKQGQNHVMLSSVTKYTNNLQKNI